MQRKEIQDHNFKTESHNYSVMSDVMHKFWQNCDTSELVCRKFDIDTKMSELLMFTHVKNTCAACLDNLAVGNFINPTEFFVIHTNKILIRVRNHSYRQARTGIYEYEVEVMGSETHTRSIVEALQENLRDHKLVKISWHYSTSRGTDSASLHVTGLNQNIRDEYYPWFSQGVNQFISNYFENPAAVLVLYGPPGTGKTSFLRHLLLTQGVNAMVTYDEKVLGQDEFFVDYLTNDEHGVLIVEDADVFLAPREDGENTMMSKFLNVSDGLIKITNKKMIFTTNIAQVNKIDSALLRPGRCFQAVEFREMTPQEAARAAQAGGQPNRDWQEQDSWSLAQIFNYQESAQSSKKFRMGFV